MAGPITRAALYPVRTPRRTGSISTHVILELQDESGIVGFGEISDLDCYRTHMPSLEALRDAVTRLVIGTNPHEINSLNLRMRSELPFYWRSGNLYPPFNAPSQLAAALEMACMDVAARAAGVGIHVLLGGAVRDRIPITYPLFGVTLANDPVALAESVSDLVAEGISTFRYYVSDLAADIPSIRELAGRADANLSGLDFGSKFRAKDVVDFLRRLDVDLPLIEGVSLSGDIEGLAWVRNRVDADVSEHIGSTSHAIRVIRADAVDVFNVTVVSGGLHLARALASIAEAAGLKTLVGTTQELGVGTAAALHLASTLPELPHPCDPAGPYLYTEDVLSSDLRCPGGGLSLPSGLGLGIELDRAQLARLRGSLIEWDLAAHGADYTPR